MYTVPPSIFAMFIGVSYLMAIPVMSYMTIRGISTTEEK